jgi:uncharacterized LabA/DUF88 family protein
VIDKVLAALGFVYLRTLPRINFRLYDGWYLNRTPTRLAQQVSTEILANFPLTRTLTDGTNTTTVVVNAELAYSMKIDSVTHLWHTYRQRGYPVGLSCLSPIRAGCTRSPCQLIDTHSFFTHDVCPSPGCTLGPIDLITRNEQKLVDTMLAADLFYLYLLKSQIVVVVSSDDDMWPTIKTVLDLGMHVIHIHTLPGRRTPHFYSHGPRPSYTQLSL